MTTLKKVVIYTWLDKCVETDNHIIQSIEFDSCKKEKTKKLSIESI